ncbi:MAG: hypothetical protein SLAVMIC_00790 [uncultured marine phage]|uniref:Uncharacterized protein n=1 Tax=uncultured marine phage TaxID=707152 RepID=A0A8D9CES8_9VIRU|nr:MAG: hypothetical protein SLAVMIC_00790 [uncultured marine phage]
MGLFSDVKRVKDPEVFFQLFSMESWVWAYYMYDLKSDNVVKLEKTPSMDMREDGQVFVFTDNPKCFEHLACRWLIDMNKRLNAGSECFLIVHCTKSYKRLPNSKCNDPENTYRTRNENRPEEWDIFLKSEPYTPVVEYLYLPQLRKNPICDYEYEDHSDTCEVCESEDVILKYDSKVMTNPMMNEGEVHRYGRCETHRYKEEDKK